MKKLSFATALLASVFAMNAQAYQFEANASYENTDLDGLDADIDTVTVSGKYYLNPVNTKNAPLAEAAFSNKASNVGVGYANASGDGPEDIDVYGVSGEFFIPDTQFYVSGALNQFKFAGDKNTGYAVEAGFLPIDGLLFAVGASKESLDPTFVANHGFATSLGYMTTVGEDTAATLRAKYVTQIGGFNTNFEAQTAIGDETAYKLGADLYIDPTLGVGVSFADSTVEDSDTIFSLHAKKFFTPQIAAGVSYTTTDGADSFGLNGTFRF